MGRKEERRNWREGRGGEGREGRERREAAEVVGKSRGECPVLRTKYHTERERREPGGRASRCTWVILGDDPVETLQKILQCLMV